MTKELANQLNIPSRKFLEIVEFLDLTPNEAYIALAILNVKMATIKAELENDTVQNALNKLYQFNLILNKIHGTDNRR